MGLPPTINAICVDTTSFPATISAGRLENMLQFCIIFIVGIIAMLEWLFITTMLKYSRHIPITMA